MNGSNIILVCLMFFIQACSEDNYRALVAIESDGLPVAILGENYLAEIQTSIRYHGSDEVYPRTVVLREGSLPEGLEFEKQENIGLIHGIPLEVGTFDIRVEAYSRKLYEDYIASGHEDIAENLSVSYKEFTIEVRE